MCSCMNVSKNSYYTWLRADNKQKASLIYLKQRITSIYNDSNQVYGSLRVQKMLEREHLFYSRSYVAFLMKELGLKSVLSKKYKVSITKQTMKKLCQTRFKMQHFVDFLEKG